MMVNRHIEPGGCLHLPKIIHASDCAIYNEPAYPAGPCDCHRSYINARELDDALPDDGDDQ